MKRGPLRSEGLIYYIFCGQGRKNTCQQIIYGV